VFVPIDRTVTFDEVRTICELVGRHLLRAHPKEITMEWATVKRTGKIFIDYNMNVRGKDAERRFFTTRCRERARIYAPFLG
jgi:bifunctional non-homologous end joining protein LigD